MVQYDQWGRRVDELQTSEGWRGLKAKMQEEGAIGIFFERKYGEFSRVYGFMKEFLATGDSSVVSIVVLPAMWSSLHYMYRSFVLLL